MHMTSLEVGRGEICGRLGEISRQCHTLTTPSAPAEAGKQRKFIISNVDQFSSITV